MIELTPEQRYRQACRKALILGRRNLRAFLAGVIPILPCSDPEEFIIAEIGRAYEAGRASALSIQPRRNDMTAEAMAPCPPDSALMQSWEAYKATESYANSYSWATRYIPEDDPAEIERIRASGANPWTRQMKLQAAEGSLWAAFSAAWGAAGQGLNAVRKAA